MKANVHASRNMLRKKSKKENVHNIVKCALRLFLRLMGGLSTLEPVWTHQLDSCSYSNWPPLVDPHSLCNRHFWLIICVVNWFFELSLGTKAFVITLGKIFSLFSLILIPTYTGLQLKYSNFKRASLYILKMKIFTISALANDKCMPR